MLVALLLPAVQSARAAARTTACKSQLRQIGLATLQFCDAHDGDFPEWWHAVRKPGDPGYKLGEKEGDRSWLFSLAPYLESVNAIRVCPDDPLADERLRAQATSYLINDYLARATVVDAARNLRQIAATTRTMSMFEIADKLSAIPENEHAHASIWFAPLFVLRGEVLEQVTSEVQIDRHQQSANYLYLDAHVETIAASQIASWIDEEYQFAKPQ
jgi:prepilin-type processing-associated H-X9-DG protein